jgi:hypothetical protein
MQKLLQFALIFTVIPLLSSCAHSGLQNFKTDWLKGYEKTALVRMKSNEKIFVSSRYSPGGGAIVGPSVGVSIGASLLSATSAARWMSVQKEFNERLGHDLKPELSGQFFKLVSAGFAERGLANEIVDADVGAVNAAMRFADPDVTALVQAVKSRCTKCDVILIVDDGFGFEQHTTRGWRAQAEAVMILIAINERAVKNRTRMFYLDLAGKYERTDDGGEVGFASGLLPRCGFTITRKQD